MIALLLAALLGAAAPVDQKVAPQMARSLEAGPAEMLVVLRDQADLRPAGSAATKLEKGRRVVGALRAAARRGQAPLVEWLERRGLPHRSFTIVSAVWTRGDAAVARALASRDDVARVEANPLVRGVLPEPLVARAPLTISTATDGVSQVNAPAVWAAGNHGEGVVVGSGDTGVEWDHPALEAHYRGRTSSGTVHDGSWHDAVHTGGGVCGPDAPSPCDDYGHGTMTTGLVVGDDGAGQQIGAAPGAKWIACRNMDQGVGSPARYLECMEFFLAPYPVGGAPADGDPALAPDVVNNSWVCPPSEGCSVATLDAALEAQHAAGILNLAAAGNSGPLCGTVSAPPATSAVVLAIGALSTGTTAIASFSSAGPVTIDGSNRPKPDLVAPGTLIESSCPPGLANCLPSGYVFGSGTSFSTPLTAGSAALLLASQPALRRLPDQAIAILEGSATPIPASSCGTGPVPNATFGWGLVDAKRAVDLAALRPIVASLSPGSGDIAGGTLVTITGANFAAGDLLLVGGTLATPTGISSASITFVTPPHAAGAVDVSVTDAESGETGTMPQGFTYCTGTPGCGAAPLLFWSVTPCRLVDTRGSVGLLGGPALAPNSVRTFPLEGSCGIPVGARALALNVAAVAPDAPGDLRVYAPGGTAPLASVVNFASGATRAAFTIAPMDAYGRVSVQCDMGAGAARGADLLLDVSGYFR